MKRIPGKALWLALLTLLPLFAGSVSVSLDKEEVVRGDTVTFSITAQGKKKAELEALSSKGLRFITETYLPEKISKKDFLP